MIKKLLSFLAASLGVLALAASVDAAVLKNAYISLTNPVAAATGTTHTFRFYHPTANFGRVRFQYCDNASGTCTDTGADALSGSTETVTNPASGNDSGNWSTGSWDSGGGNYYVEVSRSSVDSSAQGTWTFAMDSADNPAITECNVSTNSSTTTCYVRVQTYETTDTATPADSAILSMTLTRSVTVTATVNPSFELIISGVNPTQTASGNLTALTSTVTSTVSTIPFGSLTPGTAKYAAQSLTVTTNAQNGWSITGGMVANMTGTAYGDDIDPYNDGTAVVNTTSSSWVLPTGTASGTDSGWLGIGTDDGDVTGTSANDNQFFPLGTTAQTVSSQSASAQSELDIVVIGIEANAYQIADSYTGTLRYNALPTY